MSGASEAREALGAALAQQRPALAAAIVALREADTALRRPEDLNDALAAMAAFVLAAEVLEEAVGAAGRTARDALAMTMWETGATGFRTEHHTVSVSEGRRGVIVSGAVPARFMRQPPPTEDKHALHKALMAGEVVPNATLDNGGKPILTIQPIKKGAV